VKFYQESDGLDALVESDWDVLSLLLRILEVCIFFLLIVYANLLIRAPSIISKLSLLRRRLHSVPLSLLLRAFCNLSEVCRLPWAMRG
jgi:hypothetical protein